MLAVTTMNEFPIFTIGSYAPGGVYLLHIRVAADLQLPFGRFKDGKLVEVAAGEYIYLGSALVRGNTPRLGQRLARHATRTAGRPPHAIRPTLLAYFTTQGLETGQLPPKKGKKLFWHIDYLLDCPEAEITHILMVYTPIPIERGLARFLEAQPETAVFEKGLGANDDPGRTHLLRVHGGADWWAKLRQLLVGFMETTLEEKED
jgi:Uri superfamily endonuclease